MMKHDEKIMKIIRRVILEWRANDIMWYEFPEAINIVKELISRTQHVLLAEEVFTDWHAEKQKELGRLQQIDSAPQILIDNLIDLIKHGYEDWLAKIPLGKLFAEDIKRRKISLDLIETVEYDIYKATLYSDKEGGNAQQNKIVFEGQQLEGLSLKFDGSWELAAVLELISQFNKGAEDGMFKPANKEEQCKHRTWARENYKCFSDISSVWHPIVQDECNKMNGEAI